MAQARRRGTYIYFNFTDVGIFGAVVKKGVIKRRGVVSLPPGTLQGGWLQPEASLDLIFDSLLAKLKVPAVHRRSSRLTDHSSWHGNLKFRRPSNQSDSRLFVHGTGTQYRPAV